MPTIVLCLIVKNESHCIRRMLRSVLPYIDAWCVCDTGSTDGTQAIIEETLGHLPGVLHEVPWVNFGHNRTQAVGLARRWADYSLIMDADLTLTCSHNENPFKDIEADAYELRYAGSLDYVNVRLISNRHEWKYVGVTHEYIMSPTARIMEELPHVTLVDHADGSNRADKFARDIALLTEDLKSDPNNARSVFYLAQSYRDSGQYGPALCWYEKRVGMGGWDEEVWYAHYMKAKMMEHIGIQREQVRSEYLAAWKRRPSRYEPLKELAADATKRENYAEAYLYTLPWYTGTRYPKDRLFIDRDTYKLWMPYYFAKAAAHMGRVKEAAEAYALLEGTHLASEILPLVGEAGAVMSSDKQMHATIQFNLVSWDGIPIPEIATMMGVTVQEIECWLAGGTVTRLSAQGHLILSDIDYAYRRKMNGYTGGKVAVEDLIKELDAYEAASKLVK